MVSPQLARALRRLRAHIENEYGLRTESVSMMKERYHKDYLTAPQIAIVMADPDYLDGINRGMRAGEEYRLMDLLTTPGLPLVEIDRTPTRVWLAVTR